MKYSYRAYLNDEKNPFEKLECNNNKKITETITINILIELDKKQYDEKNNKYKTSIANKILKLFE